MADFRVGVRSMAITGISEHLALQRMRGCCEGDVMLGELTIIVSYEG